MPLPLVLAGPILRRVEPNLVSVWIALDRAATVTLTLWQGRTKSGAADHLIRADPPTATLRFGARLHVAQALLRIPQGSEKALQPGTVYSYDVEIVEAAVGARHTLASLGLLKTAPTRNGGDAAELEQPHLALGYLDDFLPSFSLPPTKLDELRLLYGSCRLPKNEHPDAMAWIDDLIADGKQYEDALKRPHQLVLGGDQIYADDVWSAHLQMINRLGNELIGTVTDPAPPTEPLGPGAPIPIERLVVDQRRLGPDAEDPVNFPDGWAPGGTTPLPAGLTEFPAGRRQALMFREAQMTTVDGESHLFSFGEFAAMYVMVWCNACWPRVMDWPSARDVLAPLDVPPRPVAPEVEPPLAWDTLTIEQAGGDAPFPECKDKAGTERAQCLAEQRHGVTRARLAAFFAGLPKVRRTLANVPTYMIFDDHDATDDWNLNPIWVDRVNNRSLGRAILRNALASYAVFQDWGNDPLRYLDERNDPGPAGDPKRLLNTITQMFPEAVSEGPSQEVAGALDHLLGLDLRPQPTVDGSYEAVNPPLKWHFSVPGPKHLLVALDNRTRRSFVSRQGPPGNVAIAAQAEQIPATLPPGCEVLIVVAPLQVLGPALLDEIIAPAAYRVFDGIKYDELNPSEQKGKHDKSARKSKGTRRMVGTNPDAIEAWAFDPLALEALLERLAKHRRVLLLSGDVHYTAANEPGCARGSRLASAATTRSRRRCPRR